MKLFGPVTGEVTRLLNMLGKKDSTLAPQPDYVIIFSTLEGTFPFGISFNSGKFNLKLKLLSRLSQSVNQTRMELNIVVEIKI